MASMDDERIAKAIEGLLAVAASNFPGSTDITISVAGEKNVASIRLPYYVLAGILECAKKGRG